DFQQKNQEMSDYIQKESQELLNRILFDASNLMTNRFSMGD
ncbi:dipeptidase, partial [Streptococcus agalactiae]